MKKTKQFKNRSVAMKAAWARRHAKMGIVAKTGSKADGSRAAYTFSFVDSESLPDSIMRFQFNALRSSLYNTGWWLTILIVVCTLTLHYF